MPPSGNAGKKNQQEGKWRQIVVASLVKTDERGEANGKKTEVVTNPRVWGVPFVCKEDWATPRA